MHRCDVQWRPARLSLRGIIAVLISIADRSDWSPEVVVKLRIPVEDEGISNTHSQQRKQTRIVGEVESLRRGQLAGGIVPGRPKVSLRPESHRVGLLLGALRALVTSEFLRLVVVTRVDGTGQGRWRP